MCDPTEHHTLEDIFSDPSQHLNKTQINLQRQDSGEGLFLSWFVSLSGDFTWTTQKTCKDGKVARANQISGLALFDTSVIKSSGVHIWRVEDMLAFFDNCRVKTSVTISSNLRCWATTANEYVCWSLVPQDASAAFVRLPKLTQQHDASGKAFLSNEFVNSNNLAHFR
ncbi:hypothetical protein BKA56DRAFT_191552 [Ilyonectria sp. MPI-CAGE-AT-0026]|nr:hypothetical protein BKA56DRAFT_191552 [Ilyonectria sp. MPI-CAGE-AT-0026]